MSGTLNISKDTCDFVETLTLDEGTDNEVTYQNVFFFRPPVYCRYINAYPELRTNKPIIFDVLDLFGFTPFPISIAWETRAVIAPSIISDAFNIVVVNNEPVSTTSDEKHRGMVGISISLK